MTPIVLTSKTTIQIDEDVLKTLDNMKKERGLKSYSDALRRTLKESKTLKRSERGSLPKMKPFVREKIDRF